MKKTIYPNLHKMLLFNYYYYYLNILLLIVVLFDDADWWKWWSHELRLSFAANEKREPKPAVYIIVLRLKNLLSHSAFASLSIHYLLCKQAMSLLAGRVGSQRDDSWVCSIIWMWIFPSSYFISSCYDLYTQHFHTLMGL